MSKVVERESVTGPGCLATKVAESSNELVGDETVSVVYPQINTDFENPKRKNEESCKLPESHTYSSVRTTTLRKLSHEFSKLSKNPPPGISVKIADDNLLEWEALVYGPPDSPFSGGAFRVRVQFPCDYPSNPPKVWFFSEMFHPNVFEEDGRVCIDILQNTDNWKPEYGAETVLIVVQLLLAQPNAFSPANVDAGDLFQTDLPEYHRRVKRIVHKSESYRKSSLEEQKLNFNTVKKNNYQLCSIQ